jgi:hypothetical protein
MKKLLLFATVLLFAASTASASVNVTDPAVYADTLDYKFENIWIQSKTAGGFSSVGYGLPTAFARGMAGKDGKILICSRNAATVGGTGIDKYILKTNIFVYDGLTGNLENTIPVPDSLFHVKDAVGDTLRPITAYPTNDIQVDDAGNVVLMGMTLSLGTSPLVVAVLKIDLSTGTITSAKKLLNNKYSELYISTSLIRLDAFNVFGDMYGNGYIMAAVAGTNPGVGNMVIRWNIVNGKPDVVNYLPIQINKYVPLAATGNAIAPRVTPLSETLFYLDGNASFPTIYDMQGNLADSIPKKYKDSRGLANNGVDEFTITDGSVNRNFVVYSNHESSTSASMSSSWTLGELGAGQSLMNMTRLYNFPKAGLGTFSNPNRTAVPYIQVVGKSAYIYVYNISNGLAAYKLTLKPTGLDKNEMSSVSVSLNANQIKISEEVALVEVISITGQKLISAQNVSVIDAPKTTGVYIVNIVDKNGAKKFQKISVN